MTSRERRNAARYISGEGLWGLGMALIAPVTVLAVLLHQYGASKSMIGSIMAIQGGMMVLPQLLGAYLFRSRRKRKVHLVVWHLCIVIPFLFVMAGITYMSDHMSAVAARWSLLGCFAGYYLAIGVIIPVWMDWMAHLFGPAIRGRVLGLAGGASAAVGTVGALVAGWVIYHWQGPAGFACLYLATGCVSIVAMVAYVLIDDPVVADQDVAPAFNLYELLAKCWESLHDPNFRAFLVGRLLAICGFGMLPLVAVHYTSESGGNLADGQVVAYGAAMALGAAFANILVGWLGDRRGHRLGMLIAMLMQVVALSVMIVSRGAVSCLAAYAAAGVGIGAASISHINLLFETCPHEHRTAHITVGNLMLSGATILAPLLAGMAAARWDTHTVFVICLVFSAAAVIWFAARMKEPRALPAYVANG